LSKLTITSQLEFERENLYLSHPIDQIVENNF